MYNDLDIWSDVDMVNFKMEKENSSNIYNKKIFYFVYVYELIFMVIIILY